ncbi:DNA/RNA helicase domain-containing protein [Promicromonospora sp. NPDC060271]|uniref:DNA/RNA helicase domain-containing protein n=1 Tax=Promicromonospora sp. NPDC060271 TaxID=3347089 RepID=UPI0036587CEF
MTSSDVEALKYVEQRAYSSRTISLLKNAGGRYVNWPVVYVLDNGSQVYVGESGNVASRMEQHLLSKKHLRRLKIVLHDRFNKSACLDLESRLIQLFAGEGQMKVVNGNKGVVDPNYFDRPAYRKDFDAVFEELRSLGLFRRSIPQIENGELFKYSPFKALNEDQALVVDKIAKGLIDDLPAGASTSTVIQGAAGTGKTIVAVFLLKLLRDVADADPDDPVDEDTRFADLLTAEHIDVLQGRNLGLVVPQQSLRKTLRRVFAKTPGLAKEMVLSPFDVGVSDTMYDLLVVDEAHRLGRRFGQSSAPANSRFREITVKLFGRDDYSKTQLDWIRARSRHQVFLLDSRQTVRPSDLPVKAQMGIVDTADFSFQLRSQMRVRAGSDYVGYVQNVLAGVASSPESFGEYDLRFFDDLGEMYEQIQERDAESGLARLVAGFAWPWPTKGRKDPNVFHIEIDGLRLAWNRSEEDWINSKGSLHEVGSIHTVQGYDLNYAGVIIGPDLRLNPESGAIVVSPEHYRDGKGKQGSPKFGVARPTEQELATLIKNIYAVLLTRGIRGTYVYVCDPALREKLRPYFSVGEEP